jgi:hypothetical protein
MQVFFAWDVPRPLIVNYFQNNLDEYNYPKDFDREILDNNPSLPISLEKNNKIGRCK